LIVWYWLLALAAVVAIVIAGRAHSRRLDELDDLHARGFLNDPVFYRLRRKPEAGASLSGRSGGP
jgi:hypothetical protein